MASSEQYEIEVPNGLALKGGVSGAMALKSSASAEGVFKRCVKRKLYELVDHLSNVRAVVTDVKEPLVFNAGIPDEFVATVEAANNYYAFGMLQPGRNANSPQYRYGFNGMEKDDEMKGSGNSYDFGAKIYDSRLGRWMSVDPLASKYPGWSVYAANRDNPIVYVDIDGMEWVNYYDALVEGKEKQLLDNQDSKKLKRQLERLKEKQATVKEKIKEIKENDVALYNYVENLTVLNVKTGETVNVKVTVKLGSQSDPERETTWGGVAAASTTYSLQTSEGGKIFINYTSLEEEEKTTFAPVNSEDEVGFDIILYPVAGDDGAALANEIGDVMYRIEYPNSSLVEGSKY